MNLILIGFMGTGKSTIGKLLAARLGFECLDTDQLIADRAGRSVSEIFAALGEADFRIRERAAAAEVAAMDRKVVATGGGFVLQPENIGLVRQNGLIVALTATPEAIWERVRTDTERPLLQVPQPLERIREMLAQRAPFYRRADLIVDTTAKEPEAIAAEIVCHRALDILSGAETSRGEADGRGQD